MELRKFSTVDDFLRSLEDETNTLKAKLGEYLRKMEEVKGKAESLIKLEEVFGKLGVKAVEEPKEVDLGGVKLVVNPSPRQELEVLVAVVKDLQDKIMALDKAKKGFSMLESMKELGIGVEVLYKDGVPQTVYIRMG